MPNLSRAAVDRLIAPGPRLPWIQEWLLGSVWTGQRYDDLGPVSYLERGEHEVNDIEEMLAAAAPRAYDELVDAPAPDRDVRRFLDSPTPCAVVVFDGMSVREIPVALRLAARSGLSVKETGVALAGAPSETVQFVDQRLNAGRTSPSQLPTRRDLKERGVTTYYYDNPNQRHRLDDSARALLLWSSFPDQTYKDSGARFAQHFEQMHAMLETAWLNTVQQIPTGRTILVTSDHGYVYFGAGMSFSRSNPTLRPLTAWLGGERSCALGGADNPPDHPDLAILRHAGVAMIRGRVQTHPPGQSANKLYKHGGLSLMEMLCPWIVLERSAS
jgi:hypothetical protein